MSKRFKIVVAVIFVLIVGSVTSALAGSGANPGSVNDPIITKSYVDEQINKLIQSGALNSGTAGSSNGQELIVLALDKGDTLIGKSGTEIILRGGAAIVIGQGNDGLPDITTGVDVSIGKNVTKNHFLIFPKNDRRGLKITNGPAYIMLRGDYELVKK